MTSDDKDLDIEGQTGDDEIEMTVGGGDDDIIDVGDEATPESPPSLSAERVEYSDDFDSDLDVDITGDENIDFADEDDGDGSSGGLNVKKMVAPALVLVMALGVGGYIVMNPQILGGGDKPMPPVAAQQPSANPFSYGAPPQKQAKATPDITAPQEQKVAGNSLPQPTVNMNETPRGPDDTVPQTAPGADFPGSDSAAQDITEDNADTMPAPEMADATSVSEPAFPDVTEAVDVTETAAAEPAPEPAQQDKSAATPDEKGGSDMAKESSSLSKQLVDLKYAGDDEAPASDLTELTPMEGDKSPFDQQPSAGEEKMAVPEVADVTETPEAVPPKMPKPAPKKVEKPSAPVKVAQNTPAKPKAPAPAAAAGDDKDADVYYDGTVPTGPMAKDIGPRKADPVMEPASQLVVVKKNYEQSDAESMLVSANRALKLGRYDSALDMFNQLYSKNKRDPRILMGLAVAQQNTGRSESAIQTYEALLKIDHDNADAMLNMLGLIRQQYPEVALRRLISLKERYPNNAGVSAQIGVTEADLGHYEDAMKYLGVASSLEPNNAQHVYNMAIVADKSGDTRAAIKYYEKALELDAVYSSGRSISREAVYDRLATLRKRL